MIDVRKAKTNVVAAAVGTISIAVIAVWQFRLFVMYQGSQGVADMSGGTQHLWQALGAGLMACVVGVYVFSVFVRYDEGNEMPII